MYSNARHGASRLAYQAICDKGLASPEPNSVGNLLRLAIGPSSSHSGKLRRYSPAASSWIAYAIDSVPESSLADTSGRAGWLGGWDNIRCWARRICLLWA